MNLETNIYAQGYRACKNINIALTSFCVAFRIKSVFDIVKLKQVVTGHPNTCIRDTDFIDQRCRQRISQHNIFIRK